MDNVLTRLDPRTKLLSMIGLSLLLFFKGGGFQLTLTFFLFLLFGFAQLSFKKAVLSLRPLLFFLIYLFGVYWWLGDISEGILIIWRFCLLVILAFIMISTTTAGQLVYALQSLTRPLLRRHSRNLALMLSSAMRFIPLLHKESVTLKHAMLARSLQRWKLTHVKAFVLGVLHHTFEKVGHVADAVQARCYSDVYTTSYVHLKFTSKDVLAFIFLGVMLWI